MELILGAAEKGANYVDHHIKLEEDLEELKSEFRVLKRRKIDINSTIEAEIRPGQRVKTEVTGWLEDFKKVKKDIRDIKKRKREGVPFHERASFDKLVRKKIEVVKRLYDRGIFNDGLVIEKASARGIIIPTENLGGEISTKDEIWEHLMGNKVEMIGVCGIGGVGKTTIMKHINNDLVREGRFQKVIWVTVSYPFNIFEVQMKIAGAMDQRLKEDEEMRRAAELMDIMGKVRFVLILDDVWEKFSLKDVGILEPTVQNGCKVVVTSRSTKVCSDLGCKIVQVHPLSLEKSLELFCNTVWGDGVLQDSRLKDILNQIVEKCAGLPLAIVLVAGSMREVVDVELWEDALRKLQVEENDWHDKIFRTLRFSYDRLDSLIIQKCFLYCSLFREDYEFSRRELIEGWIDDGLIDIDDFGRRKYAYNRGHTFLDTLVRNCLIEKTIKHFYGEDKFVFKMHDIVREMAIKSINLECGYMVKDLTEVPKEQGWAKDFNKLSLMVIHISKLPVGLSLKCPILSTLILSDNHLLEIPESLFEDMGALKVLDLSRTNIKALPDSICNLENLFTLRLRGCRRLTCLPSLGKLKALKKLDLRGAGIQVVPQGMEMLENLEYLDLFCKYLKEIPTGILSKLSSLQYLAESCLGETPTIKIDVEEVARLRKLETLQGRFETIHELNSFGSESKNFQSFTAYGLILGFGVYETPDMEVDKWPVEGDYKRRLKIEKPKIDRECVVLPANLEYLWINLCLNMRSGLNKTVLLENATELRSCLISDCEGIKYVVELDSSSSSLLNCPILDKLEHLALDFVDTLCALVRVEGVATPPRIFSNLKVLVLHGCSGVRKLLPLELLRVLQNLETLEVWGSQQMEELIPSSDSDAPSDKFPFTFPKLRALYLVDLPQLKSICNAKGVMVCDSIEKIRINACLELKRIPLQLPLLDDGQPSPPPHLKQIYIDEKESNEWWESVEWDYPNAKNILQPFLKDIRYD